MTNKKSQKTPNKTKQTGVVRVGVDGDMLRLQFPSEVSQKIWHIKQKYKALGLSNTPKNMAKAQEIAAIASGDILDDRLDISLENTMPLPFRKPLEKFNQIFQNYKNFVKDTMKK